MGKNVNKAFVESIFICRQKRVNFHMAGTKKDQPIPLFTQPLEVSSGLSVDDLNKYLSAIHKVEDISMTIDTMAEGVFLADALEGLRQLPDESIDLVLTKPPERPWRAIGTRGQKMTLQEYYQWSNKWLKQVARILKQTGSIYLLCSWRFSSMYHALLSDFLKLQTRITWRDTRTKGQSSSWVNEIGDIWFASKTNVFIFSKKDAAEDNPEVKNISNLWIEYHYPGWDDSGGDLPETLLNKILMASSYKLGWVVDPFMRQGSVGVVVKRGGRRFIGFETDQDRLLLAMKQIDQT